MGMGVQSLPWCWHHPIKNRSRNKGRNRGLDDVFPIDGLSSVPATHFMLIYVFPVVSLKWADFAITLWWLLQYCYHFLNGFNWVVQDSLWYKHIDGLMQDCSNSIANALELLQSCAKPSICNNPDSKVHGTNIGPTWVLAAPDGPHVGPMNLTVRER